MVTYGLLGPLIAFIRPIIALVTGLIGGAVVHTWVDHQHRVQLNQDAYCFDEYESDAALQM